MIFLRYESFRQYLRFYPVTAFLLAALIGIHIADSVSDHYLREQGMFVVWASDPYGLDQPWRYVTSIFLHGSLTHLLYNCFSLLVFAPPMERLLGHVRYAAFLLLCGVMGNVLSMVAYQFSDGAGHAAVGASGAIYGVFGAFLYMALFRGNAMDDSSRKTIYTILIFGLIYSFMTPQVDIWGHIGGAAAGFLLVAPFARWRKMGAEQRRWN